MQDWLSAQAAVNPDKTAIQGFCTYRQLNALVAQLAAQLATLHIKRGDHIAVYLPNSVEYVVTVHALIRLGAVIVPLNTRLTTDELHYQIGRAHCLVLLYHHQDDMGNFPQLQLLQLGFTFAQVQVTPTMAQAYFGIVDDSLPPPKPISADNSADYLTSEIDLDAPLVIVYTSGTTGKPKGAVLTHGNIFYSAMASAYRIGTLPDDVWLCVIPLYHIGGMSILLRACLYGIAADVRTQYSAESLAADLCDPENATTMVSLVPTILYRMLPYLENQTLSPRLRLILLGGAAASADLLRRCRALGLPVATTYGLSEAASQVATMLPDDVHRKPGSVGKPLLFTCVRAVDDMGRTQPPGEHGEIVVSGKTVMPGYFNDEDATNDAIIRGELYTGDIGYLDAEGDLWLVQRRSDLIVSGGENVYPSEVEEILKQHPAVEDISVIGVRHPEWGEQVAALIVFEHGRSATIDELDAFARQHLAGYKVPRQWRFVDTLPHTASGKIERRSVVDLFASADKPANEQDKTGSET